MVNKEEPINTPQDLSTLSNPYEQLRTGANRCFLCGLHLGETRTQEHIFPKWLQRRYDLWDQRIDLLNGTGLPYRQMKVPCCARCNNEGLAWLENSVKSGLEAGYDGVVSLDRLALYQWTAKIFFGILYKEMSLLVDRSDPRLGTIAAPSLLESFRNMHALLQSVHRPMELIGTPFSVLVVRLHQEAGPHPFYFHDNLHLMTFSIRMGGVGIIIAFQDQGLNEESYTSLLSGFGDYPLHPLQFDELYARVTYTCSLLNRTPKYLAVLPHDPTKRFWVVSLPLAGFSSGPILEEWNIQEYAQFLAYYWRGRGLSFADVFRPPDQAMTYLEYDNGEPMLMNAAGTEGSRNQQSPIRDEQEDLSDGSPTT